MSISSEVYELAMEFVGDGSAPLIEIKADMRDDRPAWFSVLVWDGQPELLPEEEEDGSGGSDFRGLTVIATGSASDMDTALGLARDVLQARSQT